MSVSDNQTDRVTTYRLEARRVFDSLADDKTQDANISRVYAHHLARACWHGSRIVLRQTSSESEGIFDFILELHRACNGRWGQFLDLGIEQKDLDEWLEFAGTFLSSLGNYFDDGGRKVIPKVPKDALLKMASISPEASAKLETVLDPMMAAQPSVLGYPDKTHQSGFYPGKENITKEEIESIAKLMETKKIEQTNTRIQKLNQSSTLAPEGFDVFEILQTSVEKDPVPQHLGDIQIGDRQARVLLSRGDHSKEMEKICAELSEALKYAATDEQKTMLPHIIKSFRTGDYKAFCSGIMAWLKDKSPLVEHWMGFISCYKDPHGARADWQAVAGIAHPEETSQMRQLVEKAPELIRTFPWAIPDENDGRGPFEPSELDVPDFAVIHVLASVSHTVWEAFNINDYDEDRKRHWVKNLVYSNRMCLNSNAGRPCNYVHPSEVEAHKGCSHIVRFVGTAIHELLGHGSGKLLMETESGNFNFDHKNKPMSPVTGQPIQTWYKPGESADSVFGKLTKTVEECRAFLVAYYLADNKDILALFGYDENSTPTADELIYHTYIRIGVEGLCALSSYKVEDQTWGGDHHQGQFAIFKHMLQDGDGVIWVEQDPVTNEPFVRVDRSKIISHGKPAIGRMLCKIQIWRSTADINACRPYYEALSAVDGEYESWRQIVVSKPEPRWKFVQPNTFLKGDGTVELKEYEANNVGVIESFFKREI